MKSWSESVTATSRKVYSIWVENHEANESASTPVLTSDASMQLQVYIPRYMCVWGGVGRWVCGYVNIYVYIVYIFSYYMYVCMYVCICVCVCIHNVYIYILYIYIHIIYIYIYNICMHRQIHIC
jgi:hypothetical protein